MAQPVEDGLVERDHRGCETDEGESLRRESESSPNRDGSTTLYLDAFPIGTNKLQVREERERTASAASGAGANGFRRDGLGDPDEALA